MELKRKMYTGNSFSLVLFIYSFKMLSVELDAFEFFKFEIHFNISSALMGSCKLVTCRSPWSKSKSWVVSFIPSLFEFTV